MCYAAVVCVMAGGLLMSGSGVVALADPADSSGPADTGSGDGAGTPTTDSATMSVSSTQPADDSLVDTAPTAPIAVPGADTSSSQVGALEPGDGTLPGWTPIPLPNLLPAQLPFTPPPVANSAQPAAGQPGAASQETPATGGLELPVVAAPQDTTPTPVTLPPTISLVPLVPDWIKTGPPVTIHNPLRDLVKLDVEKPIVPQLLPPAIVQILSAMAQQYPLTDLVLSPLMNDFGMTPLLSEVLPVMMSDIVVPTLLPSGGAQSGPPVPGPTTLSHQVVWSLPNTGPPPAELAPTGMDMPRAPTPPPLPPLPGPVGSDPAPQPISAPPPPADEATPVSEPVAYRAGYSDYLRNAGMAQITSYALPGIVGILLVTVGGGFIGYRQARAGHVIRTQGIARFLR